MKKYINSITESYEPLMNQMPIFVSFKRTGTHFLMFLMAEYYDRLGLFAGMDKLEFSNNYNKFLWFHIHDIHCSFPIFNKVLYLYRNPIDVIASSTYIERNNKVNKGHSKREIISVLSHLYKKHLEKYLIDYPNEVTLIRYEKLLSNGYDEFKKVCQFFNTDIDKSKFEKVYEKGTKEAVIKKLLKKSGKNQYYDNFLLSQYYKNYKINFKKRYSSIVNDIVFKNEKINEV